MSAFDRLLRLVGDIFTLNFSEFSLILRFFTDGKSKHKYMPPKYLRLQIYCTVHIGTVYTGTVYIGTVHIGTVHGTTVHDGTVHKGIVHKGTAHK